MEQLQYPQNRPLDGDRPDYPVGRLLRRSANLQYRPGAAAHRAARVGSLDLWRRARGPGITELLDDLTFPTLT